MIPRMKPMVYSCALALAAVHCGGSSTPPSNTASQSSQEQSGESSGTYGAGDMSSDSPSGASQEGGARAAGSAVGSESDTGGTQSSGATSSTTSEPSGRSEWTNDQRMPVAGRDEGDMGPGASPGDQAAPLTDAQIAGVLDFVNNTEIQQAQMAQTKTQDPHVLSYASMMIAHHTDAKQQQAGLGLGTAGSSALQRMSSDGQRTLATLRDKSGKDFDRAYLRAQVDQHQKALDTLDRQLLPSAQNPQFRSQLTSLRSKMQQHLQMARDALKAVGNHQGSSGKSSSGKGSNQGSGQRTGTGSATQP